MRIFSLFLLFYLDKIKMDKKTEPVTCPMTEAATKQVETTAKAMFSTEEMAKDLLKDESIKSPNGASTLNNLFSLFIIIITLNFIF
jgi:hypothetical protein